MNHYNRSAKKYVKYEKLDKQKHIICNFCDGIDRSLVVAETDNMWLLKNRVPYDMFDGVETTGEHLLVVPKRHIERLTDFTDTELRDMIKYVAEYEGEGYSIYARSKSNVRRSQRHQHTHLIRLGEQQPHVVIYTDKPYNLVKL